MTPTEIHRVGYLGALPTSIFDERYRYVALGHIHRSYFPEKDRIAYSGSPIALNFTEPWGSRRCLMVELGDDATVAVSSVPIPCWRRMITLRGTVDEVLEQAISLEWAESLPPLVRILATATTPDAQAYETLSAAFESHGPVRPRILELELTTPLAAQETTNEVLRLAQERVTPERVFRLAWHSAHGDEQPPEEMAALFSEFVSERPEVPGASVQRGDQ